MTASRGFEPEPLFLSYGIRRYAFGARLIADRLGKPDLPAGDVAETWEVSDHDDEPAVVLDGPQRGRRLRELVRAFPDQVVGSGWRGPHLPLLVKFLDASHRLPVHVHPDDAAASERYGAPNGKDEAWHVLWAEPGASVLVGVREGVDGERLRAACRAQAYDDVLLRYPVAAGDTVLVPGGVLHTFGPGTLILEVQQTSDLSASVMPDDVYGRRLAPEAWAEGIEEALAIATSDARPRPGPGVVHEEGGLQRSVGCRGPRFVLERWRFAGPVVALAGEGGFATLTNVGAPLSIEYAGGTARLERAASCLLPAALGEVRLQPLGQADLVACFEPAQVSAS